MKVADLQKLLRDVDPAAVLVSPRILERVVREACHLPTLYWNIPHWKSYVVDRQTLYRHAEQADLELAPDQLLPNTVILLVRPAAEELSASEEKYLKLKYWRGLFHCSIHRALGAQRPTGSLTPEEVRERIEQIGRTEFEEIRIVLEQDRYLPPNADDRTTYIEFAAVYLELDFFANNLLLNVFPGIRDFKRVKEILTRDVNAQELYSRTRLEGAPDPEVRRDTRSDESDEAYLGLVRAAQRAVVDGNLVRAAILRTRAARIAPGALTATTRMEASKHIAELTDRLAVALPLTPREAEAWKGYLNLLLDKADQGSHPVEARLLFDLQEVCIAAEREVHTLDVVEWLLSGFRRPVKRPLPSQRFVRIIKHLRNANSRLSGVRLPDDEREQFSRLLHGALSRREEELRKRFEPVLQAALKDVGLDWHNALERVAFDKMVEELLDRINTYGFLTFSDLRDTISRNQLKLPDLSGPEDFIRGDPLVLLDKRLASLLDGVYRPSEFYVRWLERFTSLKFGTVVGRAITRFVTVPFGGAFLLMILVGMFIHIVVPARYEGESVVRTTLLVLQGSFYESPEESWAKKMRKWEEEQAKHPDENKPPPPQPFKSPDFVPPATYWHYLLWGGLGVFLLTLIQLPRFRRRCYDAIAAVVRGFYTVLIDWPRRALPVEWARRFVTSWGFQLVYWYLVKPAFICAIFVLIWPDPFKTWPYLFGTFAVGLFLIDSRVGRASTEALFDLLGRFAELLRAGLLPNLVSFIMQAFKYILDLLEYLLFTVDEWLRFRGGDSRLSLVVRTILSVLWFPFAYAARFFVVVLIEPGYNPLKAPVSYLAAKLMSVQTTLWLAALWTAVEPWPVVLRFPAFAVGSLVVVHLCDFFGFLFWEMKENWSLYRANRGKGLKAVLVGSHGETVRGLLQPGFHSGTIPKLYKALRKAERQAYKTRNWHAARHYREQLKEVADAMCRFVSREMLALLQQSKSWEASWKTHTLRVGTVHLTINRIRFELVHSAYPASVVEVELKLRDRWLVAGLGGLGWLLELNGDQLRAFVAALAGFYKMAGVDLVLEQVLGNLPASVTDYDITPRGLELLPAGGGPPLVLDPWDGPRQLDGRKEGTVMEGVVLPHLLFSLTPLSWEQLVENWQKDQDGKGHPPLPDIGLEFVGVVDPSADEKIAP